MNDLGPRFSQPDIEIVARQYGVAVSTDLHRDGR